MTDFPVVTTDRPDRLPKRQTDTGARAAIADRVLIAAGLDDQISYASLVARSANDLATTGLVVGGSSMLTTIRQIRAIVPELFIMCDPPESGKYFASADCPFPLGPSAEPEGLLPLPTLAERLDSQITAGANVAVTPTGYIRANDRETLRAVIQQANELQRDDTIVQLPLDYQWLRDNPLTMLTAAINRSAHPIAITLGDSNSDPLGRARVLDGARSLCTLDTPPMFHRIDLGGFHLMGHGALAASIGVIGSKRRAKVPDAEGFSPSTNQGATVLVQALLRFKRSLDMQTQWFGSKLPYTCPCAICRGAAIDRFESYDDPDASRHNATGLINYINEAHLRGGYRRYWPDMVSEAEVAHVTLGAYVGTRVPVPSEVKAWAEHPGTSTAVKP